MSKDNKPMQLSTDSVICPYCGDVQGTYPDDFMDGGKFEDHGWRGGSSLRYVCDRCLKSYSIALRKAITINTIGEENE